MPQFIVTVMYVIPRIEHTIADVLLKAVKVGGRHGLSAQIYPIMRGGAAEYLVELSPLRFSVLEMREYTIHGIVDEHVAIGMVGIVGLDDMYRTVAMLYVFTQYGEVVYGLAVATEQTTAL